MKKQRARSRKGRGGPDALPKPVPGFSSRGTSPSGLTGDQYSAILDLIELIKQNNLAELELEREGFRVRLRREVGPASAASIARDAVSAVQEVPAERRVEVVADEMPARVIVRSPIVGTFYRSPSPEADPYVEEGDLVKKGQVLCIVEAMKLMNEIESEVDGRVVQILAESTKPVEYGQPLFLIDPTPSS